MKGYVNLSTRASHDGSTATAHLQCHAPYMVMHPFKRRQWREYMVMCSSAGMLAGDDSSFEYSFGARTRTKVSTQSYEKVLDTGEGNAEKTTRISAAEHCVASVVQQPTIACAGSSLRARTDIELDPTSALVFADCMVCGRVAHDERFAMSSLINSLHVSVAGVPVFRDVLAVNPAAHSYDGIGQWGEFTHCATMYIHLPDDGHDDGRERRLIESIRSLGAAQRRPPMSIGATKALQGMCVRIMASNGQAVMSVFSRIEALFDAVLE